MIKIQIKPCFDSLNLALNMWPAGLPNYTHATCSLYVRNNEHKSARWSRGSLSLSIVCSPQCVCEIFFLFIYKTLLIQIPNHVWPDLSGLAWLSVSFECYLDARARVLHVTSPQLDGFVILQSGGRDDVLRGVTRTAQHYICNTQTHTSQTNLPTYASPF